MKAKLSLLLLTSPLLYGLQSLSLHTENDVYFPPTDYDRYYTAGHSLSYTSMDFENSFLDYIGLLSFTWNEKLAKFSVSISQEIHTPDSKTKNPAPKGDGLYGGYLYATLGVHHYNDYFLESLSLELGVVGPWSFAQQTQNFIHSLLKLYKMPGWDTQIQNEFIFNLYHRFMYRFSIVDNVLELLPYSELALGNAHIYAGIGLNLRIGYGLREDFGITKVRTSNVGITTGRGFRFYILAGINERIIGRNIMIEGNSFGGKRSDLEIKRFVYEASLGALIGYYGFGLSYVYSFRQEEFATQKAPFGYGSIRLEVAF